MNYTPCGWEPFWDLFGTGRGQWRSRAELLAPVALNKPCAVAANAVPNAAAEASASNAGRAWESSVQGALGNSTDPAWLGILSSLCRPCRGRLQHRVWAAPLEER